MIRTCGWHDYLLAVSCVAMGLALVRFVTLYYVSESPKYLLASGDPVKAVRVVQRLARCNGTTTLLTESVLDEIAGSVAFEEQTMRGSRKCSLKIEKPRVFGLFRDKTLGVNTVLLWGIWTLMGAAFP